MKTYSRIRRQEEVVIEDVDELCRLCLGKAEDTEPIFKKENVCAALPMRIMICLGYEISQEENLPNAICTNCHQELERYYKFRKKCEKSYIRLKAHVTAIKRRTINHVEVETDDRLLNDEAALLEYQKIQEESQTQVDEMERLVIADMYHIEEGVDHTLAGVDHTLAGVVHKAHSTHNQETAEIQPVLEQNEVNPDISTFLNAILIELGVLGSTAEGLTPRDLKTRFQLETGDGDQLDFQLLEEDEDSEAVVVNPVDYEKSIAAIDSYAVLTDQAIPKKGKGKTGCTWCNVCGRTFGSRSAMRRHGSVHTGARPHACPDCGRAFAQKVVMERHRLVHMKNRPFKCTLCPKSFTQRGTLATHARSHSAPDARPLTLHACSHCDRMFLYASGLSRHMVTHSGRVFSCEVCARLFNDKSSLVRHARTHTRQPRQNPPAAAAAAP